MGHPRVSNFEIGEVCIDLGAVRLYRNRPNPYHEVETGTVEVQAPVGSD